MKTHVMKFGGASVAKPENFDKIADLILLKKRICDRIVIVISAMGNTTNELISLASKVSDNPPRREYDMLVTVGERISISLLAMALAKKGQDAISFTGSQAGVITTNHHSEAKIIDMRPRRVLANLDLNKVVIVAGFQGVSLDGEITTLGRGGSDTTAVALGVALRAENVAFYKDVKGIYDLDPKSNPDAKLFNYMQYKEALTLCQMGAKVLHSRSVSLAMQNNIPLLVRSFVDDANAFEGTLIHNPEQAATCLPRYEIE